MEGSISIDELKAEASRQPAVLLIARRENADDIPLIHERGLASILLNTHVSLHDALAVTAPFELDLNDDAETLRLVQKLRERFNIRAVFTINEYRLVLAAKIAEALGITHALSATTAATCRSKIAVRKLLRERGLDGVHHATVRSPEEALDKIAELGLPLVVKPSNDAGSHFVTRCDTPKEVWNAVKAIKTALVNWVSQPLDEHVLLEEYLEGPEFSVESASDSERTEVIMITAKATQGMVEVGHIVPAPLSPSDAEAIRQLVTSALKALGVRNAVTHTEVKLTRHGPRIVEVNARVGGDRIHKIVEAVTGIDLIRWALHLALGGRLEDAPRQAPSAAAALSGFLLAPADGLVSYRDPAELSEFPGLQDLEITVSNGDRVVCTTSNYDRIGQYILHAEDGVDIEAEAKKLVSLLEIQVTADPVLA
jgi:biotin carboxylase